VSSVKNPQPIVDERGEPYRTIKTVPIEIPQEDKTVEIERQTVSIMKACEVVGVSRRTIYNWMAGGKIQYVRTAGGSVRIFADSLWKGPNGDPTGESTFGIRH
jgi:excisionase family DNA binding protein